MARDTGTLELPAGFVSPETWPPPQIDLRSGDWCSMGEAAFAANVELEVMKRWVRKYRRLSIGGNGTRRLIFRPHLYLFVTTGSLPD